MKRHLISLLTLSIYLTSSSTILCMDTLENFLQALKTPELPESAALVSKENSVKQLTMQSYTDSTQPACVIPYLPTPFAPYKQPNDSDLKRRRILCNDNNVDQKVMFPNSEIIPKKPRSGTCLTAAMEQSLGFSPEQFEKLRKSMIGGNDWFSILKVLQFFEQKEKPELNASALYVSSSKKPHKIRHAARVKRIEEDGTVIVQSKFGIDDEYIAGLFEMPDFYGDTVFFCTLKKGFTDISGKKHMFFKLQERIAKSEILKSQLEYVRNSIFEIANTPTPDLNITSIDDYMRNSMQEMAETRNLLERFSAIDIDARDTNGNTILMCAAINGKQLLAKTLITYGAEIDIKNNAGFTAVDLAKQNGHTILANFILNQK